RLANVYGPRNYSGPIPTFFKRLSAGQECTVTDTRRDTVFVDDLLELVLAALDQGETGKFDVCSGQAYPIRFYYDAVAGALGGAPDPAMVPAPAGDVAEMELDPIPAAATFGWRATTPLTRGIAETVAWYQVHGVGDTYSHLRLGAAG
ncbi:MAG TPA: NAD-dependent epimerase/dehydratase family protein, partial [Solirubrobacterales bacterium]